MKDLPVKAMRKSHAVDGSPQNAEQTGSWCTVFQGNDEGSTVRCVAPSGWLDEFAHKVSEQPQNVLFGRGVLQTQRQEALLALPDWATKLSSMALSSMINLMTTFLAFMLR